MKWPRPSTPCKMQNYIISKWHWCFLCIFKNIFETYRIQQIRIFFHIILPYVLSTGQDRHLGVLNHLSHRKYVFTLLGYFLCYIRFIQIFSNILFFFYGYISKIVFTSVRHASQLEKKGIPLNDMQLAVVECTSIAL